MECVHCSKTYQSKSSLHHHQKTNKTCLSIQEKLGLEISDHMLSCPFCDIKVSSKFRVENHLLSCKKKKEVDNNKKTKHVQEQFEIQLKCKDDKIKELQDTINMLRNELQLYKEKNRETDKEKPHKKIQIPKAIKKMVWNLHVGSSVAETVCLCCQQEQITMLHFHCGHVVPESKGGLNTIENLRPICGPCNMSMGTQHMKDFIRTFFNREMI
jgi:hypothetical protein